MDLILWRHAEAEFATGDMHDSDRKLTAKGLKQAAKMAFWLDSVLPDTCRILVSPAVRTRSTADALLEYGRKYKVMPELGVDATVREALLAANWPYSREPVMIVGHQPYLGAIVGELLGHPLHDYSVRKSNVWWISQKQKETTDAETYLKAIMAPDLVLKS